MPDEEVINHRHKPVKGPKRKKNPHPIVPRVQNLRHSYSLRRKARPTILETSERTKIPYDTIKDWRKPSIRENIIRRAANFRRIRPCEAKWPKLEDRLTSELLATRRQGKPVRLGWIRKHAFQYFKEYYPDQLEDNFCFSAGWLLNYLNRNAITFRAPTNKGQKVPKDYQTVITNFLRFIRRNTDRRMCWLPATYSPSILQYPVEQFIGCIPHCRVGNMDQTPLPFEFLDDYTYDALGTQSVQIKSSKSGWDKRQATIMITCFADGLPHVKPVIIFKCTPDEKLKRPRNTRELRLLALEESLYGSEVTVWHNEAGYCDEGIILHYLKELFLPALDPPGTPGSERYPSLIALDAARIHRTEKVKTYLQSHNVSPALIPGGCTPIIQPVDVVFNQPFKKKLSTLIEERLDSLEESLTVLPHTESLSEVAQRRAWKEIHEEKQAMIVNCFRSLGYSSIDDNDLFVKGFENNRPEVGDPFKRLLSDGSEEVLEFPQPTSPSSLPILDSGLEADGTDILEPLQDLKASSLPPLPFATITDDDSEIDDDDFELLLQPEEDDWEYIPRSTRTRQRALVTQQQRESDTNLDSKDTDSKNEVPDLEQCSLRTISMRRGNGRQEPELRRSKRLYRSPEL
ncbi:hypothetical protein K440DRAFT_642086 [Wilcoxina mikolae CBS 423.85]|nr:hypothetical protein K440DRAFT_642086 [Wilcoxina mikolae CBS 423.85]